MTKRKHFILRFSTTHENVVADSNPGFRIACSQDDCEPTVASSIQSTLPAEPSVSNKTEDIISASTEVLSGRASQDETVAANVNIMMTRSEFTESCKNRHPTQAAIQQAVGRKPNDLVKRSQQPAFSKKKAAFCSSLNTLPRESKAVGQEVSNDSRSALTRSATDSSISSYNPSYKGGIAINSMVVVTPSSEKLVDDDGDGGEPIFSTQSSSNSKSSSPRRELREATVKSLKCPYPTKSSNNVNNPTTITRTDEIESYLSQEVSDKSSFGVMSSNIFMEPETTKCDQQQRPPIKSFPISPTVEMPSPCAAASSKDAYVSENISNEMMESLLSPLPLSSSASPSLDPGHGDSRKSESKNKTAGKFTRQESHDNLQTDDKLTKSRTSGSPHTTVSPVAGSQQTEHKKSSQIVGKKRTVQSIVVNASGDHNKIVSPDGSTVGEPEAPSIEADDAESNDAKLMGAHVQAISSGKDRKVEYGSGRRASLPSSDMLELDKELQQLTRSQAWVCKKCTLSNATGTQCAACGTVNGADAPGNLVTKATRSKIKKKPERPRSVAITEYWPCPICTLQNPLYLHNCQACRWDKNNEHGVSTNFILIIIILSAQISWWSNDCTTIFCI